MCYVCPVILSVSDSNAIIGRQSWIMFAIITVEVLIEIKFGWDIITALVPWYFLTAWAVLFVAIFIWAAWKFTVPFKECHWTVLPEVHFEGGLSSYVWD